MLENTCIYDMFMIFDVFATKHWRKATILAIGGHMYRGYAPGQFDSFLPLGRKLFRDHLVEQLLEIPWEMIRWCTI